MQILKVNWECGKKICETTSHDLHQFCHFFFLFGFFIVVFCDVRAQKNVFAKRTCRICKCKIKNSCFVCQFLCIHFFEREKKRKPIQMCYFMLYDDRSMRMLKQFFPSDYGLNYQNYSFDVLHKKIDNLQEGNRLSFIITLCIHKPHSFRH